MVDTSNAVVGTPQGHEQRLQPRMVSTTAIATNVPVKPAISQEASPWFRGFLQLLANLKQKIASIFRVLWKNPQKC